MQLTNIYQNNKCTGILCTNKLPRNFTLQSVSSKALRYSASEELRAFLKLRTIL